MSCRLILVIYSVIASRAKSCQKGRGVVFEAAADSLSSALPSHEVGTSEGTPLGTAHNRTPPAATRTRHHIAFVAIFRASLATATNSGAPATT
jgi:hypothetical protein